MIAGVMRIYPGSVLTLRYSLPALQSLCDRLYILRHNVALPNSLHLENAVVADYSGDWDHQKQLTQAFHLADCDKPEWVIFPDSDEVLPAWEFPSIFAQADAAEKPAISFPFAVPWNGFARRVSPRQVATGAHVKAVRWTPDVDFNDPGGFCMPRGYWGRSIECESPLLTAEIREARKKFERPLDSFFLHEPDTVEAPKEWATFELQEVSQ